MFRCIRKVDSSLLRNEPWIEPLVLEQPLHDLGQDLSLYLWRWVGTWIFTAWNLAVLNHSTQLRPDFLEFLEGVSPQKEGMHGGLQQKGGLHGTAGKLRVLCISFVRAANYSLFSAAAADKKCLAYCWTQSKPDVQHWLFYSMTRVGKRHVYVVRLHAGILRYCMALEGLGLGSIKT